MENITNEVMANFRRRGDTVKEWSKKKNFSRRTVAAVINGERAAGGRRGPRPLVGEAIRQALIEDGYWPQDDDNADRKVSHSHNA